jgi:hypothetical protein
VRRAASSPERADETPRHVLCPSSHRSQSVAVRGPAHPLSMGTKSRETIYGGSVRAAAERASKARKKGRPARLRGVE